MAFPPDEKEFSEWLESNNIEVLNVAGHSEKTCEGTEDFVLNFLTKIFKDLFE